MPTTDLALPHDLHGRAPARRVVTVADLALRSLLVGQAVETVVTAADDPGHRIDRLGQPIAAVPGVVDRTFVIAAATAEAGESAPVEPVVLIDRHLAAPVGVAGEVAAAVVSVAVGCPECIGAAHRAVHGVVSVTGRVAVGIRDAQEVLVMIVAELRHRTQAIDDLREIVKLIVTVGGRMPQRIGHTRKPARTVR